MTYSIGQYSISLISSKMMREHPGFVRILDNFITFLLKLDMPISFKFNFIYTRISATHITIYFP